MRGRARPLALAVLVAAGGCQDPASDDADPPGGLAGIAADDGLVAGDPVAPLTLARDGLIVYRLAWSWEGAAREGDAWVFVTDLGYTIGIEAAYVATAMIELAPCEATGPGSEPADAGEPAGAPGLAAAAPPPAQAAHGGGRDSSAAVAPIVEVIDEAPPALYGAGVASGAPYCGAHLLGAPIDAVARDGEVFDDQSARFVGWWTAPGDDVRHDLDARVNLQRGSVRSLAARGPWPEDPAIPAGAAAVITITRAPALAFDGVDLAGQSALEIAYAALGGVMQSGVVEVALAPAS